MRIFVGLVCVGLALACESPLQKEERTRLELYDRLTQDARLALSEGQAKRAVALLQKAVGQFPADANLHVSLAEAYQAAGNDAAAILSLKQAEELLGEIDPSLMRSLAELYKRTKQMKNAILQFSRLRDRGLLTENELLELADMLSKNGQSNEALRTLEPILVEEPPKVAALILQAQIVIDRKEDRSAEALMNKLVDKFPNQREVRLLRARYFHRIARKPDKAYAELQALGESDRQSSEVVQLLASVLGELGRLDEVTVLLDGAIDLNNVDQELVALLAEVRLEQNKLGDATELARRVLDENPSNALALYVRGRIAESQGQADLALADYRRAITADADCARALRRKWKLELRRGMLADAMSTLEQLMKAQTPTHEEKAALAQLYADTGLRTDIGLRLINEALVEKPGTKAYLATRSKLAVQRRPSRQPKIIRGGR